MARVRNATRFHVGFASPLHLKGISQLQFSFVASLSLGKQHVTPFSHQRKTDECPVALGFASKKEWNSPRVENCRNIGKTSPALGASGVPICLGLVSIWSSLCLSPRKNRAGICLARRIYGYLSLLCSLAVKGIRLLFPDKLLLFNRPCSEQQGDGDTHEESAVLSAS